MTNGSRPGPRHLPLLPLLSLLSLLSAVSMFAAAAAPADELRLPDLIVRPELLQQMEIDLQTMPGRELLRLTTGTANIGTGPLELRGGAIRGTQAEVAQRIYRSDGGWLDRPAGIFTYHPDHGHVHFDDWAVFRLRQVVEHGGVGAVAALGSKISFCLFDFVVYDATNPFFDRYGVYGSCGFDAQGISPGWGDTYDWWLPDQWIDISDVPDGDYWLEVEVDPDDRLLEADETNNLARVLVRLRPPPVRADRYEENDSFDEVAARGEGDSDSPNLGRVETRRDIGDLSMDDDRDLFFFRLDRPAEPAGFARLESPWRTGNLDLALFDSDRALIASSLSPGNSEHVPLGGLPAGAYFIEISARSGTNPGYTLTLDPIGSSCPLLPEGEGPDADGDRRADACDNCPAVANPDQTDANGDGSGDGCQPALNLAGIVQDGGELLEVRATARDPQGDPLSGRVVLSGPSRLPVHLQDALQEGACDRAYLPDAVPGEGIGFTFGALGNPYLFDIDVVLLCRDGVADYLLAPGACAGNSADFDTSIALAELTLPAPVCIRPAAARSGGTTLRIEGYDSESLRAAHDLRVEGLLDAPFAAALPRRLPLPPMVTGEVYELTIDLTDGTTTPVSVHGSFVHSGERTLLINTPPIASITTPEVVECDRPAAGAVTLDGGGSGDPDSPAGAHDDIVGFDWFEDFGGPGETRVGTGERVTAILPLGSHRITLRVTDSAGETGSTEALVTVRDTTAPELTLSPGSAVLWPPDHRLVPVSVSWEARDLCDPSVRVGLASVTSSEPDDAIGAGDGATTGDIRIAVAGTPDASVLLRAERAAGGPGRTYTLAYAAVDHAGNGSTGRVLVTVPNDRRP